MNHNITENDNFELLNKVNIVYSKDKIKLKNQNSKGNTKTKQVKSKLPSIIEGSKNICNENQNDISRNKNIVHKNIHDENSNKTALMNKTQNQSMAESFTLDENVV